MALVSVTLGTAADGGAVQRLLSHTETPFDIAAELARSYARLWVARVEPTTSAASDELFGFLLAWDVVDEVHVIDLVVAEEHRRKGVGGALIAALVQHARTRNSRLLLLEVRKSNQSAIRLYERCGFERAGERAAYYADGEAALLMKLVLR